MAEVRCWSPVGRSEPERLHAGALSRWRARGQGRIHLPRLNSFDSLSAPAAPARHPDGRPEAGTSAVQGMVTEGPITPRREDIDFGTPSNVWMQSLTNGQQSTDSIRAGREFDQTEGQPVRRAAAQRPGCRLERSIARNRWRSFGLQFFGSGRAPQLAWSSFKFRSLANSPAVSAARVVRS